MIAFSMVDSKFQEVVSNRSNSFPEQLVFSSRRKDVVVALVLISAQGQLKKCLRELICNIH